MEMFGSSVSVQTSPRLLLVAEIVILYCSYSNEKNLPHYINDISRQLLEQLIQISYLQGTEEVQSIQNEPFPLISTSTIRSILKICRINVFLIQ